MKTLTFTVTNDLRTDQRMIRICSTLAEAGYLVRLIGVQFNDSPAYEPRSFKQHRIKCFFRKGFAFYAEYNTKLFFYLLLKKTDLICAIDLDTIIPCFFISVLKSISRVYDAHELFCEMKEVVTRPFIYRFWKTVEKIFVPKFQLGYTVSRPIAEIFKKEYGVDYGVIRNMPRKILFQPPKRESFLLYQGAVNEGRSFETLIPAMEFVDAQLHIYGDGNYMDQVKSLIKKHRLGEKVLLKGKLSPEELRVVTASAKAGITLFENKGLSNYYSLANRFFDYIQGGTPQLCVDYPAYREINETFEIAVLIDDLSSANIARHLNNLLQNEVLYRRLQIQCTIAALQLNWQKEEQKLLDFYRQILH
ncbi:glycosyltransferase [Pollutibacter soli]|uniref:glycosyltransferase n=1 Tax=Pollutibacter soli TaxID=3034157 RepID=UPI00301362B3